MFSNSLGTDFRIWEGVLGRLRPNFRMIAYDLRGHGLSGAPNAPYRLADHVGDLAALLDALGVRDAIVCGVSVGGMIGQGLAAARPELVRGLVLCDTAHQIRPQSMWDQRIEAVRERGIEALADPILERWFSESYRVEHAEELIGWRHMLVRTPVEGYIGTCAAIRDADLTEAAQSVAVPTLCVCGTEDGATPPELVRSLADLIPGGRFQLIDGAGHLPCVEAPDTLADMMMNFMKETGLVGRSV